MTHAVHHRPVPAAEYLAAELSAPAKSEYVAGRVHAMAGASWAHEVVAGNVYRLLHAALPRPCLVAKGDVKVRVEAADAYYYPDVLATCDRRDRDPHVVLHPLVVVEVLSPTTEGTDRREKLPNYQTIPSLRAVLLVHADRRRIEWAARDGGAWLSLRAVQGASRLDLPDLGLAIALDDVYAGTEDLPGGGVPAA